MELQGSRSRPAVVAGAASRASAVVAIAVVVGVVAWEVAHPTLPAAFELAVAARAPSMPSWAMRLPMAVMSLAGMAALYIFLRRIGERRAGGYALAVLATAPAWFVHGRTMTGAIVPLACSAMVLAGLGIAVIDERASDRSRWAAVAVAVAAAAGSVLVTRWNLPNRGLVAIAGPPMVAVGAARVLWAGERRSAAFVLAGGLAMIAVAAALAISGHEGRLTDVMLGARTAAGKTTFDAPVAALAYGLVPWTPFVPLAIARRPQSPGHLAIMLAAVLGIAAHAVLAPRTGATSVVCLAAIAGSMAMMLRSIEDTKRPAVALVATVLAVGWLVAHDVRLSPERVLLALRTPDTVAPVADVTALSLALRSSVYLCIALSSVALVTPRDWLPAGRGLAIAAAGIFAGLVLRAHTYPEVLSRLSPGAAFDAWARYHREGEPLGLVGVDRRSVAFAPGTAIVEHRDAPSAARWLAAASRGDGAEPRRFLALGAADLAAVNAEYRGARGGNVPILDGQRGTTLLAASALARGEHSDNPLDTIVLAAPPASLRPVAAVLDERLEAVGWQLLDDDGRTIDAVPRGSRSAHVRMILRASAGFSSSAYCTFLHIDNSPSRFSAEHRELPYPIALWRAGDVLADDFEVKLPAHFHAGTYRLYWGVGVLPCDDDRRLRITSGPNDGRDRVPAGMLEVR